MVLWNGRLHGARDKADAKCDVSNQSIHSLVRDLTPRASGYKCCADQEDSS